MTTALARRVLPMVAVGLLAVAATTGTALANPDCGNVTPALGETVSCEYAAGGSTTITVPANTIRIVVAVRGGGGGAGGFGGLRSPTGYSGGSGAQVVATLLPSNSTALTVTVGSSGQPKGLTQGGTGGGFSAIYDGSSPTSSSVIAVAGGGGGGGYGTRCTAGGVGGQGGRDDLAGGGDARGLGGDGSGSGGLGGAVPPSLTGTSGFNGSAWSAGGAGGAGGTTRGGDGGDGYGGGGGGGFVNPASSISCPPGSTGDGIAANDGSGGGAGSSYVLPARSISSEFGNEGGSGGTWTGPSYVPASSGSVTLTFVGATYTVTYDGNGATGGSVPTDLFGPYVDSRSVTVCDDHRTNGNCDFPNEDRLTRTGYTFDGWNTAANGSGTSYAPTNTFAITGNTILYAQWKALPSAAPQTTAPAPTTPAASPALRTTKPKTTATGATVTFTAPGPGSATASGTASQATRAGVIVCSGTTKVRKAGKAVVICKLNAAGRRLRAKGALTVVLTTTFVGANRARLQASSTVTFARRG